MFKRNYAEIQLKTDFFHEAATALQLSPKLLATTLVKIDMLYNININTLIMYFRKEI